MDPAQPAYRASDSLAGLRHRWWLVALLTGLGLATAGGWLHTRPVLWESTASVLVHPAGQDTNVVGGRTQGEVNLDTEAQLVRSTAVAAGAAERLGRHPATSPQDLAEQVRVEVPPNTSVLTVSFAAGTPAGAQAGARAFAKAYLQHREQSARAGLAAQRSAIDATLDELDTTLSRLNAQLAGTLPGTATAADLESERGTVLNQINSLTDRRNELATATISPGTVISEAQLPAEPSRPRPAVVLASGAALGLAVGAGAAGLTDRLARRVRRPADLPRRLGVPVLAAFPRRAAPPHAEVASPYGAAGRTFDRLRNEVIAAASGWSASGARDQVAGPSFTAAAAAGAPGGENRGRVVVVTGPDGGSVAGPVAVNLAASLSRSGHEVVLVEAAGPGAAGPLPRLLGVAPAPGLSELLAGRASLAGVLQQPPRYPRLRVVTMGGTATATGLLQSPALRTVLAATAAQAGYVVVAAPATSTSADAQSLASHADLALLAVAVRRTRFAEVADAAGQLQRVGTRLLGAVVLPPHRLRRLAGPDPADLPPAAPNGADPNGAGHNGAGHNGAGRLAVPPLARLRRPGPPAPRPTDDPAGASAAAAADGQTMVLASLAAGDPEPLPFPDPDAAADADADAGTAEPAEPAEPR